jgi:hypothetical protein
MSLPIIQEDSIFVAIPVESTVPLIAPRKQSDVTTWDVEDGDRWAGLKHGGLCVLILGFLGYIIYLYVAVIYKN